MNSKTSRLLAVLAAATLAVVAVLLVLRRSPSPAQALDPFALLPARCEAVAVVPDPGRLGEHLAVLPRLKLAELASSLGGYPSAEALFGDLARQAGWDPRSRDSMRQAGIDPGRELVGYLADGSAALLAIPAADSGRLDALLARHAGQRLGARSRSEEKVGERTLVRYSLEGQSAPALAWVHAGGYAFLSQGAAGAALLKASLAQPPEGSLARDPGFAAARTRLSGADAWAWGCPSRQTRRGPGIPGGSSLAVALSERELRLQLDAPLTDAQAGQLKSLGSSAGAELVGRLDPNAFLVLRVGADPALLEPVLGGLLPPFLRRAFQAEGIEVQRDLVGNLKPGLAASVSLAPTARLAGVPALDARRTNPFDYLLLHVLGRPADPARAEEALRKVAAAAPRFGARMEERTIDGTRVLVTTYHLGEGASLAIRGDHAVVTGGAGQMQAQLSRLAAPEGALQLSDPEARRALREDAFALHLDVGKLASGIRTLPDSAYGVGGFAIKAAALRWLDALEEVSSVRLSGRLAGKALQAELSLALRPAAPTQAQTEPRTP